MQAAPRTQPAAACPVHQASAVAGVAPDDLLVLPLHRRIVAQYLPGESGATELFLFHGDQEISFDEPELFAFGEMLATQSRFVAGSATGWGEGYAWAQVQPLLSQLVDEGVLHHAEAHGPAVPAGPRPDGARPAPLPAGPCPAARTWADPGDLMADLTGLPLEHGHLELVVPVFRLAHLALDADGRQVGESNVFPPAMRLDVPTNWRTCIYPGTRFQTARPMNVTALKAMRAHWPTMMALIERVRSAYLARFPEARAGWTVGHLERLSTAVLALPTYLLMRRDRPVANGALHPALSSMFRVTDGVRMTMHQMLFVPVGEPTLPADAPMDAAALLAYAERNYSFHSEHGVCAGPRAMIEAFLGVLVDGVPVAGQAEVVFDAALQDAVAAIEPALDYALLGLQAYAAVFSLWPQMGRAWERLHAITEPWAAEPGQRPAADPAAPSPVAALQARLHEIVLGLRHGSYLAHEGWRADREAVYADMFAQCGRGLGDAPRTLDLAQRLNPTAGRSHGTAQARLAERLRQRLAAPGDAAAPAAIARLAAELIDFLAQEQALLQLASATQARINRLLGRPAPRRPFGAAEVDGHNRLQGSAARRVPDLVAEWQALLGVQIRLTPRVLRVDFPDVDAPAPAARRPKTSRKVRPEKRA